VEKKKNVVSFGQAEQKARQRDFDLEKLQYAIEHGGIPQDQLENALSLLSKATGREHFIGTKRTPQSRVRFVQFMQDNLHYLYEKDYLTGREKIFLMDIAPYVAFSSNCIVQDVKVKNPAPANVSEIAKLIKSNRSNTSTVVNSLVKKGLLAKAESGIEGNNAKAYAIFVNPHILYAGDKESVNDALQVMFHKAMKMPIFKELPDKFF
jgi:hypothetical protein